MYIDIIYKFVLEKHNNFVIKSKFTLANLNTSKL